MSNTRKTWKKGDVISADDLNRLEAKISKTLLWENASPESSFNSPTIVVDPTGYAAIEVHTIAEASRQHVFANVFVLPVTTNYRGLVDLEWFDYNNKHFYARNFGYMHGKISVADCYRVEIQGESPVQSNDHMIPYKIYGIKGGNK